MLLCSKTPSLCPIPFSNIIWYSNTADNYPLLTPQSLNEARIICPFYQLWYEYIPLPTWIHLVPQLFGLETVHFPYCPGILHEMICAGFIQVLGCCLTWHMLKGHGKEHPLWKQLSCSRATLNTAAQWGWLKSSHYHASLMHVLLASSKRFVLGDVSSHHHFMNSNCLNS